MRAMTSIRARLIVWFTALLAIAGFAGGGIAYWAARLEPDAFLDDQLRQVATTIADVESAAERIGSDPSLDSDDAIVVQVWDEQGRAVVAPPNVEIPRQASSGFREVATANGPWRTFTLAQNQRTTQVSQQIAFRHELAVGTAWSAVLPIALIIPLSWLLVRWLVGRILRPLDAVSRELGARPAESSQKLASETLPDEIRPLVQAMNEAFTRLMRVLDANRRFVSDAAHQLRTPLTALRLQVQNLERRAAPGQAEPLAAIKLGLKRMTDLTAQLLTLARAEAAPGPDLLPADLGAVLSEAVAGVSPLAEMRRISLDVEALAELRVIGEPKSLVVLFSNLIDNSIRYTPEGGHVRIRVAIAAATAVVTIADSGPGLPEKEFERVFDRFYRHDPLDNQGTGLGLAIARAIAARSMATLTLANREEGTGLLATIALRLAEVGVRAPTDARHPSGACSH